jgi:hypothetical protein
MATVPLLPGCSPSAAQLRTSAGAQLRASVAVPRQGAVCALAALAWCLPASQPLSCGSAPPRPLAAALVALVASNVRKVFVPLETFTVSGTRLKRM